MITTRQPLKPINPARRRHVAVGGPAAWLLMQGPQPGSTAGDVLDVVRGTAGVRSGGCTWTHGPHGPCLAFDGTGTLDLGNTAAFSPTAALDLSCWFQTAVSSAQYLAAKHDDSFYFGTGIVTAGKLHLYIGGVGGWYVSVATVTDNSWHHGRVVYDGGAVRVYVDGRLDSTFSASGTMATGPTSLQLGIRSGGGGFAGAIDDFRFGAGAASTAEVARDFADPYWRVRAPRRYASSGHLATIFRRNLSDRAGSRGVS